MLTACSDPVPSSSPEDANGAASAQAATGQALPQKPAPAMPPAQSLQVQVFDDGGEESKALADRQVLPAWSAVHERYRLLDRRGESGLVFGTLLENDQGLWLVDETEGEGTLAISVLLPGKPKLALATRVVLRGAWKLSSEKHWQWKTDAIWTMSEKKSESVLRFPPGLVAHKQESRKLSSPSTVSANMGGTISFRVVQPPKQIGDGWLIGDAKGGAAVARLMLPGERSPYGDQSDLSVEEQWQLALGTRYWVQINRFRRPKSKVLPIVRAISVPSPLWADTKKKSAESL